MGAASTGIFIIFVGTGGAGRRFRLDEWKYLMAEDDLIGTIT
jgi:hypothetical protein